MFGRITQGQQRFFLNSQEIPGVQSITASFQTNATPVQYLGNQVYRTIPNGIPNATVSVNRYVVTQDYFAGLTGSTGFNGCIINKRNNPFSASERNFAFISGYMTSHRLTVGLDGIPQTATSFTAYNQFGGLPFITDTKFIASLQDIQDNAPYHETLKVSAPWTVDVNIDGDVSTTRIQSLDLQISPQYTPLYGFGSKFPKKVEIKYPIEITLNFRLEIEKFGMEQLYNFPGPSKNVRNVSLVFRSHDLNEIIATYGFNEMELLSESYQAGVGQNVILDGTYRTFLARPT